MPSGDNLKPPDPNRHQDSAIALEPMAQNDLLNFMRAATDDMAAEYQRIQARAKEDPGTAGDQGEENWASLLRRWLPSYFQVVTKGRILSTDGTASPQVDVLVLSPAYPSALLDKKTYLAGGVVAAFECKITLTADHVRQAVGNAVAIRKLIAPRQGTPYRELHSPILYGLLAHSHSWREAASKPIENVETRLVAEDQRQATHPREMLELVCVADVATWVAVRMAFIGPNQIPNWEKFAPMYGKRGAAMSNYVQHSPLIQSQVQTFTPIGTMLTYLLQKLAWEHDTLRSLADYFRLTNVGGSGGGNPRLWEPDIYSAQIRQKVASGHLSNGVPWDEWSVVFL
jgi:hypothetical protein